MTILINMVTNGKTLVEAGQSWNLGTIRRQMAGLRMNQNPPRRLSALPQNERKLQRRTLHQPPPETLPPTFW